MQSSVGAYELIRPLGAGGMAETFVAQRSGPGGFRQRVCLKRILPERSVDPQFVELFLDEARLLAQMRNGRIVQVYDFGESDGTYYMALELIEGVDLEKLLARTIGARMSEELAVYVVSELLSALAYAHTLTIDGEPMQIVHRDISPSNVLISREGELKLTDFGIAKARRRTHRTQVGETKGKLAYMSPEQMRAEALDCRSDLFAVGIVLHELVSGVHPFDAPTDVTLMANLLYGQRPSFRALAPHASGRLVAAIDALLEPDPANRPLSALEAQQLLPSCGRSLERKHELATWVARCAEASSEHVDALSSTEAVHRAHSTLSAKQACETARSHTQQAGHVKEFATAPGVRMHVGASETLVARSSVSDPRGKSPRWKLVMIAGGFIAATVAGLQLSTSELSGREAKRAGPWSLQAGHASQAKPEQPTQLLSTSAKATGAEGTAIRERPAPEAQLPPRASAPDGGAQRIRRVPSPTHVRRARAAAALSTEQGSATDSDKIEMPTSVTPATSRTQTSFSTDDF